MGEHEKSFQDDPGGNHPPEALSREKMESICRTAIRYLETSRRYLSPDYCIWELARETKTSAKQLSASINRHLGQNFFRFINNLRIEEAKRILREAAEDDTPVNISEVGRKSGFNSRTSFYRCFTGYVKMTPGQYMALHVKESRPDDESQNR